MIAAANPEACREAAPLIKETAPCCERSCCCPCWVASGQSNMEWPVRVSADAEATIRTSKNPLLRLFTVAKNPAVAPQRSVQGSWQECGPATLPNFSAVAYFFGRDLQKARNVPVG